MVSWYDSTGTHYFDRFSCYCRQRSRRWTAGNGLAETDAWVRLWDGQFHMQKDGEELSWPVLARTIYPVSVEPIVANDGVLCVNWPQ
jgi:NADH:ubiquinone oxidoreductase subunit